MSLPRTFPCHRCGADLAYDPGQQRLACPYCGTTTDLGADATLEERDLLAALAQRAERRRDESASAESPARTELRCSSCGASVQLESHVTALRCPWCSTPIQRGDLQQSGERVPVDGVLPFACQAEDARRGVSSWLRSLWLAPATFTRLSVPERLAGVYVPYWTFDALTATRFQGQRGERRTRRVRRGGETRSQTRVDWQPVAGEFERRFDDLPVAADPQLPETMLRALEPWPLERAVRFDPRYLAGFLAGTYALPLDQAFKLARARMQQMLEGEARQRIGGDLQRIDALHTRWHALGYKHLLLPVWVLAFRWRARVYRVIVNGATGEVRGERPWSPWKVALAVATGLALAAGLAYALHGGPA